MNKEEYHANDLRLIKLWQDQNNLNARNELVEIKLPFIDRMIGTCFSCVYSGQQSNYSFEDLFQQAVVSIVHACNLYKDHYANTVHTYLLVTAQFQVLNYINTNRGHGINLCNKSNKAAVNSYRKPIPYIELSDEDDGDISTILPDNLTDPVYASVEQQELKEHLDAIITATKATHQSAAKYLSDDSIYGSRQEYHNSLGITSQALAARIDLFKRDMKADYSYLRSYL